MKRILCFTIVLVMIFTMTGCGKNKQFEKINIGVSMPSIESLYQNQAGNDIKNALDTAIYNVILEYADDDAKKQEEQIRQLIRKKCKIIVVMPVESEAIEEALIEARVKGICVIAYDELIMNSDALSYYVAFDKSMTGKLQAKYIIDTLKLDECKNGESYTLEIFSGVAGDETAKMYYNDAMSVLSPYISSGALRIPSGERLYEETSVVDESGKRAVYVRMKGLLEKYYSEDVSIDAVLCLNDETAVEVSDAIENNYEGYFPVITGSGCTLYSVRNMAAGKQSMSVFTNTKLLADKTVELVDALLNGLRISAPDFCNNGRMDVPAFICEPSVVDTENFEEVLINSGYYSERQVYE